MNKNNSVELMQNKMKIYGQIIVIIFMIIFAIPYYTKQIHFGLLDYVNLPFHEAGHFVFGWFGEFIGILGGTMGQFFVPGAFLVYFLFFKKDYTASLFSLFWFFENFVNMSIYMADAQMQALPYIGGEVHDWAYLFAEFKCITKSFKIAGFFRTVGLLGMFCSIFTLFFFIIFNNFSIKIGKNS